MGQVVAADYSNLREQHHWRGIRTCLMVPDLPEFMNTTSSTSLVVAGADEGGFCAEVERMVRQAGLAARVRFLGLLASQDLADAYAGVDALLLPSHHENFGNVVVEATAQGTPVIISDKVALRDWVLEKEAGIVLPLEPEAWTRTIEGLDKREISSRWAPERLMMLTRESFAIESVARRMLAYYQGAINVSSGK